MPARLHSGCTVIDIKMGAALPEGFRVGHWTNDAGTSGCTVLLPPRGNVTAYDAPGASPGSRELACLDVQRARTEVHGIVLTGGSAYGLAAADGAMRWLEEQRIGFEVGEGVVPIVPAAVIFDRAVFSPAARPNHEAGYAACAAASAGQFQTGRVGAGAGATAGKWAGLQFGVPGGLGSATVTDGSSTVSAIAVVNPVGDVISGDGAVVAGTSNPNPSFQMPPSRNTVLIVLALEASGITKADAAFLAARGSDGITLAVRPAHTRYDGDVVFACVAPGSKPADMDALGVLATQASASAIRHAVG